MNDIQKLHQLPALADNYIYVIEWNGKALALDPGEAAPLLEFLKEKDLHLEYVLITHGHVDHVKGLKEVKEKTECHVIGPDDEKIEGIDQTVEEGEELIFGPFTIDPLSTPGHAEFHLAYYFKEDKLIFTGDFLFGGGCGRLFEGTAAELFDSLQKICRFPGETRIYGGHEYTVKNLEFAKVIEPENGEVAARLVEAKRLRSEGRSTYPSTLELERKTNPFLRLEEEAVKRAVGLPEGSPLEVFTALRSKRDQFYPGM